METPTEVKVAAEMVRVIAMALANTPSEVRVTIVMGTSSAILEVRAASGEIGQVIGKQGRTVRNIRDILRSVGVKDNILYTLNCISDT